MQCGVGRGVRFSGKMSYEFVLFNIRVMKGWVGVKFPEKYVT